MAIASGFADVDVAGIKQSLEPSLASSRTLDEAAGYFTNTLYAAYQDYCALVRLYVTLPYGDLPKFNAQFVADLASDKGVSDDLSAATPVLSLMGTFGKEPAWCDRKRSRGHVGIPLTSSAFADAIPMVSRLLRQMGLGIDWLDAKDVQHVAPSASSLSGSFYVADAASEFDAQGRKIIPAQDFVREYGIRTVFGVGAGYEDNKIAACIVFCTDHVSPDDAQRLQPLVETFVFATQAFNVSGAHFA